MFPLLSGLIAASEPGLFILFFSLPPNLSLPLWLFHSLGGGGGHDDILGELKIYHVVCRGNIEVDVEQELL